MHPSPQDSVSWPLPCSALSSFGMFGLAAAILCCMLYRYAATSSLHRISRVGKKLAWLRMNEMKRNFYKNERDVLHNGYLQVSFVLPSIRDSHLIVPSIRMWCSPEYELWSVSNRCSAIDLKSCSSRTLSMQQPRWK